MRERKYKSGWDHLEWILDEKLSSFFCEVNFENGYRPEPNKCAPNPFYPLGKLIDLPIIF